VLQIGPPEVSEQSPFFTHSTQRPLVMLQTAPKPQPPAVQRASHAFVLALQNLSLGQLLSVVHATQRLVVALQ
jgi:hypothetical protein